MRRHRRFLRVWAAPLLPVLLLLGGEPRAQQARGSLPPARFEVVSIKELPPDAPAPSVGLYWVGLRDPSEWQSQGQPLLFLVMAAYGIGEHEFSRIVGLPKWSYTEFFDIEARVPPHASNAQIPLMVQAMLADRFKLKAHWEERQMRAAAMTVAPGGPKMQRDPACSNPDRPPSPNPNRFLGDAHTTTPAAQATLACGTWAVSQANGVVVYVFHGFTMQQLANLFSGGGDRPLLRDRTGLAGAFDFALSWPHHSASGLTFEQMAAYRAQLMREWDQAFRRQLGLSVNYFKPVRMPVPVLVIDRVSQPTPN